MSSHGVKASAGAGWNRKGPCDSRSRLMVLGALKVTICDLRAVELEAIEAADSLVIDTSLARPKVEDAWLRDDELELLPSCLDSADTYFL